MSSTTVQALSTTLEKTKLSEDEEAKRERSWRKFCEFNKVLTLSYMLENEPFLELPKQYRRVIPQYGLFPPRFVYGFPRSLDKQISIARKLGVIAHDGELTSDELTTNRRLTLIALNQACGLEYNTKKSITLAFTCSKVTAHAFVLESTQKDYGVPKERMEEVVEIMKGLTGDEPAWFIFCDINKELSCDYSIPDHFFRY